jgi:hypothetical protein
MGRIALVIHAALMCALGLSLIFAGLNLIWLTAPLGLFLCGLGLLQLSTALWRGEGEGEGEGESDARAYRLMRGAFALYLASGVAAGIAAWANLPLPAAIVASVFVACWIWLWGWGLAITRKPPDQAA